MKLQIIKQNLDAPNEVLKETDEIYYLFADEIVIDSVVYKPIKTVVTDKLCYILVE